MIKTIIRMTDLDRVLLHEDVTDLVLHLAATVLHGRPHAGVEPHATAFCPLMAGQSLHHLLQAPHQGKQITGPRHLTGPTDIRANRSLDHAISLALQTSGQTDHWTTPSHWPYRHQGKQITGPRHLTGPTDIRANRSLDHAISLVLQTSGQTDHWTTPSHWPYRHQDKQTTGPRHLTGPKKTSGQTDHWTTPSHWPYKDIRTNRSLDHAISLALQRHQDK